MRQETPVLAVPDAQGQLTFVIYEQRKPSRSSSPCHKRRKRVLPLHRRQVGLQAAATRPPSRPSRSHSSGTNNFFLLTQSAHLYLRTFVLPPTPTDTVERIFSPSSYAATRNRTHVSSVAPLWGTLIQEALPTELPWPQQGQTCGRCSAGLLLSNLR